MAAKYLRSAAAGTGTGADWTNAYTTLTTALAGVSAGDTIYVADDHAESTAGALTFTSPGTATAPVQIICVNTHVTTPPTATATSATVTNTGVVSMTLAGGFAYVYGVTFSCATGTSSVTLTVGLVNTTCGWTLDNCTLKVASTGAGVRMQLGPAGSTSGKDSYVEMINTTLQFAASGQTALVGSSRLIWRGATSTVAGTLPTTLLTTANASNTDVEIAGVDLSPLTSGKTLISMAGSATGEVHLRNCKLGSSVTVTSGTVAGPGAIQVFLENCDSGTTNYRMEHYRYEGSIVNETTKVKTSGATDGTTALAHKFVSLASGPTLFGPLRGPWMHAWNDTTGSSLTATVDFLHDSLTNLQNSDIYLEVEWLNSTGSQSSYSISRVTDVFATAADCPASTATWTTTGLTNPNKQKLQVSFTPLNKGPVRARVCLAKTSYTVYVDPLLTIT